MKDSNSLYKLLQWAQRNGEPKTIDRIRVMVLPMTISEGIHLGRVDPSTTCSPECFEAIRKAAERAVGRSFA